MTSETPASSGAPSTGLGPWMRFRRQYSRLSPPVQMIGLQLWLPLVFVIAFCLCYINAFHQPSPKDIKVAVVGTGPAAVTLADRLEGTSNGMLSVSVASSVDAARGDVRDGDLAAAFTPGAANQPARLLVASGAQFQFAEVVQQTFAPVAAAEGSTLAVGDLAPLPKHDSYGTSGFYIALVWTIAGYMVGMFIGMMGQTLKHRVRLGLIVGSGFVLSLLGTLFAGPVVGAVHGHFLSLWLLGWLTTIWWSTACPTTSAGSSPARRSSCSCSSTFRRRAGRSRRRSCRSRSSGCTRMCSAPVSSTCCAASSTTSGRGSAAARRSSASTRRSASC
ncbi:ABC transporter permease [Candidatus Frankia alpina]|uniref:ABC transporter permease n=1 Tax=Candidatus Frankia alpina TaxID=2699483 RepID=UPI001F31EE6C|nr:ABC transporter permease [Candidatus Frankia alpina]